MSRKYCIVNSGLANHLRNALWGVVELQLDGYSLWITYLDLLRSLPSIAGLTPGELVEFVDASANTYL